MVPLELHKIIVLYLAPHQLHSYFIVNQSELPLTLKFSYHCEDVVPFDFFDLYPNVILHTIQIGSTVSTVVAATLAKHTHLTKLIIRHTAIVPIIEIPTTINTLIISNTILKYLYSKYPPSLRRLHITHNPHMLHVRIPTTLVHLDLSYNPNLFTIEGLMCASLKTLNLSYCNVSKFVELPTSLIRLYLVRTCIQDINFIPPNLQTLDLTGCYHLKSINKLSNCSNSIRKLYLDKCVNLKSIEAISSCYNLLTVSLQGCVHITNVDALKACTHIRRVNLAGCYNLDNINGLKCAKHLVHLDLFGCSDLHSISPLKECSALQSLNLSGCFMLFELNALVSCLALTKLDIYDCCPRLIVNATLMGKCDLVINGWTMGAGGDLLGI